MSMRKINILWLDDGLSSDSSNNSWINLMRHHMQQQHPDSRLIECVRLDDFAKCLRDRHELKINHEDYIDWIWLDVMLKRTQHNADFSMLGFPKIKQITTEAGSQIVGLMNNPDRKRDTWLQAYEHQPKTLLTSLPTITADLRKHVASSICENTVLFCAKVKNTEKVQDSSQLPEDLKKHIHDRLDFCRTQIEKEAKPTSERGNQ